MKTILQYGLAVVLPAMPLLLQAQTNVPPELPSLQTIGKHVAERVQKDDDEHAFKKRYGYIRDRVTEYWNSDGELKKREEKMRTNNPTSAPIASLPQPQSQKKPTKAKSGDDEAKLDVKDRAFEKSDFTDGDLLSRFEFTLVGRETLNGRSTLVIDFKPARKQPPERNIKDKFISKAAGRAWVDEEEFEPAKIDLHLTERVNVVGGLVGAVWKFNYHFDRERTSDGFWFARSLNWHMEGREVFFRRIMDYHEEKRNVKKVW